MLIYISFASADKRGGNEVLIENAKNEEEEMNKDNRMDDWMIAIKDKKYRDKLLDEYGLANVRGV